jgi:hypothetical protein
MVTFVLRCGRKYKRNYLVAQIFLIFFIAFQRQVAGQVYVKSAAGVGMPRIQAVNITRNLHLCTSDDYEDILVDLLQTGNECKSNFR